MNSGFADAIPRCFPRNASLTSSDISRVAFSLNASRCWFHDNKALVRSFQENYKCMDLIHRHYSYTLFFFIYTFYLTFSKIFRNHCKKRTSKQKLTWEELDFLKKNFSLLQNVGKLAVFSNLWFLYRGSHQRCSVKKGVLRNFAKFKGKHLSQSFFFNKVARFRPATLLIKRLWDRCFPMNFAKFPRTSFLQNTSGRLLLFVEDNWLISSVSFFPVAAATNPFLGIGSNNIPFIQEMILFKEKSGYSYW